MVEKQITLNGAIISNEHLEELRKIREEKLGQLSQTKGIALKSETKIKIDTLQFELKQLTSKHYSHNFIVDYLLKYSDELKYEVTNDVD